MSPSARLRYAPPALIAALTVAFTLRRLDDFDVWFHLAGARLMLTTWRWPATNTFAYTAADHPWVDIHWLFQLVLYGAYAIGGANGCILLAVALMLATVAVLWADARRFAPPAAVAALMALAITVASPRFVPRPELVGFLLLAVWLWLLDDYPRSGAWIYVLVPLQIVWTNAHGSVPLGLPILACYWLGATLAFLPLPAGWRAASGCTPAEWRRLTLVVVLATAATVVNPWGIAGALLPVDLLRDVTGQSALAGRIGEFRSPMQSYPLPLRYTWLALVALGGISFLVNPRRWHLGRLFAVTLFAVLSARALRNVAPFAWIAVPAIAASFFARAPIVAKPPTVRAERRRAPDVGPRWTVLPRAAEVAVCLAIGVLTAAVVTNRFSRLNGLEYEFGFGMSRLRFPFAAVEFARTVGIRGRPFNCFPWGGYLAWAEYPEQQVFVDGRTWTYPAALYDAYFRTLDDPRIWPEVAGRYGFDYALVQHYWDDRYPLIRYLLTGHGWTLVYYDDVAAIFMPQDEAHREVLETAEKAFGVVRSHRQSEPPPAAPRWRVPVEEIAMETAYGEFLRLIGQHGEAIQAYTRALALDPDAEWTRHSLGIAYWFSGQRERAVAEWREILRRDPSFEPAKKVLAEAATHDAAATGSAR